MALDERVSQIGRALVEWVDEIPSITKFFNIKDSSFYDLNSIEIEKYI